MRRVYRKIARKIRRHHKKHLSFIEMLRRYTYLQVGGA